MKRLRFQATCPGCGDTHLAIECKKPTFIVANMVNVRCDACGSTILIQIALPRPREANNQLSVVPVQLRPSAKARHILNARAEAAKAAIEQQLAEQPSSPPQPTPEPVVVAEHGQV